MFSRSQGNNTGGSVRSARNKTQQLLTPILQKEKELNTENTEFLHYIIVLCKQNSRFLSKQILYVNFSIRNTRFKSTYTLRSLLLIFAERIIYRAEFINPDFMRGNIAAVGFLKDTFRKFFS